MGELTELCEYTSLGVDSTRGGAECKEHKHQEAVDCLGLSAGTSMVQAFSPILLHHPKFSPIFSAVSWGVSFPAAPGDGRCVIIPSGA
jgi:hypothetical protein